MSNIYMDLLRQWCDAMLDHQVKGLGAEFDGALLCPACRVMHGRCMDAVYPLLYMADATGEQKYVDAAKAVFDWNTQAVYCDDGSTYNDLNSAWNGITVFGATALCEALHRHSSMLDADTKAKWEDKLRRMAQWLYENLNENMRTNINYVATNSAALALCGTYLGREDYIAQSKHLAAYVLNRFTENGLLYGEGKPRDSVTPRGCRPIDIGYNVEESVPSLVKYALCVQDEPALQALTDILRKQLQFMLPDGAWDNSFGSRNNKWTYYGSRTSDGCASAYALMADRDPMFAEAALRNVMLLRDCSQGGLLHGGRQYHEYGEKPCIHHTFTHANALTAALDAGIERHTQRTSLPADSEEQSLRYFPELDTWKISVGKWNATITGYDYDISAGHVTGGTLTLLWHRQYQAVIAASVVEYKLVEPHNQQLSLQKARHRSLVPRAEIIENGIRYAQCYDTHAAIVCRETERGIEASVRANLVTSEQAQMTHPVSAELSYLFTENAVRISGKILGEHADKVRFVLPLIAGNLHSENTYATESAFFLTPGFGAVEYSIAPDADGCFQAIIQ